MKPGKKHGDPSSEDIESEYRTSLQEEELWQQMNES